MLSNFDLEAKAKKYKLNNFRGVFSKDNLPNRLLTGSFIINMQDEKDEQGNPNPGSHWVALYIDPFYNPFYFDSFGFTPPIEVEKYSDKTKKKLTCNGLSIQNMRSEVCGLYALTFCIYMYRKETQNTSSQRFRQFLQLFSEDSTKNETILKTLL